MTYFSHDIEVSWIVEHFDLDPAAVDAVLTVEWEYMVATGIAEKPQDALEWEFRYYQRGELDGAPRHIDTDRIARDAERLAGVPQDVGLQVSVRRIGVPTPPWTCVERLGRRSAEDCPS